MVIKDIFQVVNYQRQIELFSLPLVDVLGVLSFLILLITLTASLKAARETARANILSSLPVITLSYAFKDDIATVVNSGHGTAVNIKVDNFYQWWADKQFNFYGVTIIMFESMGMLKPNEKQVLQHHTKGLRDPLGLEKFAMFSAKEKPLLFAIRFSDLSGKRFITKIRVYKNTVEITSFPKSFGFTSHIDLALMRIKEATVYVYYFIKVFIRKHRDKKA